jgi:Transposase DDE domain
MKEPFPPRNVDVKNVSLKPLSKVFGRLFDFPRASMFFLLLAKCGTCNWNLENGCDYTFNSSDRLFFYIRRMGVDTVTHGCNKLLGYAFKVFWTDRRHHLPVFLAIDTTDLECKADNPEYLLHSVEKRGLKVRKLLVIRFATLSIVAENFKLTLAVLPVRKEDKTKLIVEKLVDMIPPELTVRAILMDKGFYSAGVISTVERMGYKYIIPVKHYQDMDLEYHIAELTGVWRFKHTMNPGRSNRCTYDVLLQEAGLEYYIGFATNLDVSTDFHALEEAYSLRCNIEVGYKESLEYKIKTRTRTHSYRVLIFTISHLLMNLQSIIKKQCRPGITITISHMKQIVLPRLLTQRHGKTRMGKRFILVY